jgi:hypothetical protein
MKCIIVIFIHFKFVPTNHDHLTVTILKESQFPKVIQSNFDIKISFISSDFYIEESLKRKIFNIRLSLDIIIG